MCVGGVLDHPNVTCGTMIATLVRIRYLTDKLKADHARPIAELHSARTRGVFVGRGGKKQVLMTGNKELIANFSTY